MPAVQATVVAPATPGAPESSATPTAPDGLASFRRTLRQALQNEGDGAPTEGEHAGEDAATVGTASPLTVPAATAAPQADAGVSTEGGEQSGETDDREKPAAESGSLATAMVAAVMVQAPAEPAQAPVASASVGSVVDAPTDTGHASTSEVPDGTPPQPQSAATDAPLEAPAIAPADVRAATRAINGRAPTERSAETLTQAGAVGVPTDEVETVPVDQAVARATNGRRASSTANGDGAVDIADATSTGGEAGDAVGGIIEPAEVSQEANEPSKGTSVPPLRVESDDDTARTGSPEGAAPVPATAAAAPTDVTATAVQAPAAAGVDAADGPGAPREGVAPPPAVDRQVVDALRLMPSADGRHEVRLVLHPGELGEVRVRLVVSEGGASVYLGAQTDGARDAIQAALPQLRDVLQAKSLEPRELEVSLTNGRRDFAGTAGGRDADEREAPREDRGAWAPAIAGAPAEAAPRTAARAAGIDLRA